MSIRGLRRAFVIRFTRRHVEREVDDELAFHVAQRTKQLRTLGMSAEDARVEAVRRFGDIASTRNACIEVDQEKLRRDRLGTFVDHLWADLRFATRSLKRARGFTAVALTTLVVGIASVTTIFSFVYGWAFRPLPYKDATRIVAIEERRPIGGYYSWSVSVDAAHGILSGSRSFERIALFDQNATHAALAGKPRELLTLSIDTSFVPLFGVQPERGRTLTRDEILSNAPAAMISDLLWRTSFGAEPSVVGRAVRLGNELITVVGVMPPGFRYPDRTDLWRPLHLTDSSAGAARIKLLGKLAPGVTAQQLAADLSAVGRRLIQDNPSEFAGATLAPQEMLNRSVGGGLPIAGLFVGAAILVLLIACSNVANLLLVRAAERRGEMAVRASLGAGRGRLMAQALTEAVVLAAFAGLFGTLLSMAFVKIALANVPTVGLPSWMSFGLDGRILVFVIGMVTLVTLAVGLTPAREGTRFDLVRALKAGGDAGSGNSRVARSAQRSIIVQLALSVVLFVGAALLVQTYRRLGVVNVGYPAEEIVSLQPFFDQQRYPTDTMQLRFAWDVLDRVKALAGARDAALRGYANVMVLSGSGAPTVAKRTATRPDLRLFVDGDTTSERRTADREMTPFAISETYFHTLGLRVIRGRAFTSDDVAGSQPAVVVSKRVADLLWPNESPMGHVLQFGPHGTRVSVIGVADDVHDLRGGKSGLRAEPNAYAYFSVRQVPANQVAVLVRGSGDVSALQRGVEAASRRLDPDMLTNAFTMAHDTETERMITRLFGSLIGAFAISGLILSVIGIYGIVAFGITQRTREIGIRMALGGTSRDVLQLVLRQSLKFVGVGLAAGVILSLGAAQLLRVLLFGVSPTDPMTYTLVCVVFGGVAVLACYLPARRATLVDPLTALRAD